MHLVGCRRLLLLLLLASMARRSTAWRASRMRGIWRILLTGMCHRTLRWMLWERVLARGSMRRRLQRCSSLAMEACRARRRTLFLWRRILRRALLRWIASDGGRAGRWRSREVVRLGLPLGDWRRALQWLCLRGGVCCVDYRPEIHDARLVDMIIYCFWSDRALVTIPI